MRSQKRARKEGAVTARSQLEAELAGRGEVLRENLHLLKVEDLLNIASKRNIEAKKSWGKEKILRKLDVWEESSEDLEEDE